MPRPREFNRQAALDAAVEVFREHGFAGTSTEMLTTAMQIGRQSLYDTFGDKWRLYGEALQQYSDAETRAHIGALGRGGKAIDGIARMLARVVAEARQPCLGIGSISEFGGANEDLAKIREVAGNALREAMVDSVRRAQSEGDVSADIGARQAAAFLQAQIAAIRLAARGGAGDAELRALGKLALKALS
ncbi:TetR/AcrR family transcriptional regulator [Variovorax sp. Sphag1AA]|uniref:TetR/AcrR family transcriptional regulator n=1 Tax=Variovorax sp. Sphag1AA TaxID=2587027 RepID=UPI00161E8B6D|nr:TetR/AcrR family transcriptional regulator [Variovorax sp. Sphag1AA]MBB3181872.1 AcrR family transcriptional regulator [Variovorax sp. Sphag1AA]